MIIDIGYRMVDNSRLLRRIFDERVRHLGLTAAQARLLLSLDRHPGQKQSWYAELLEIEPITLTRTIDRMEDAGWLKRCPDPADRRANLLHLTEKSRDKVEGVRSTVEQLFEKMLGGLNSKDRAALLTFLESVNANLIGAREKELVDG